MVLAVGRAPSFWPHGADSPTYVPYGWVEITEPVYVPPSTSMPIMALLLSAAVAT